MYACSIHPTVPGRVYCAGERPETAGTLNFCLQPAGEGVPTCQLFPEYDVWMTELPSCTIPAEPYTPTCADYTDPITCEESIGECTWDHANDVL